MSSIRPGAIQIVLGTEQRLPKSKIPEAKSVPILQAPFPRIGVSLRVVNSSLNREQRFSDYRWLLRRSYYKAKRVLSQSKLRSDVPNISLSPFCHLCRRGFSWGRRKKVNMEAEERKGNHHNNTKDGWENHKESFYIYLNLHITHISIWTHTL